MNGVTAPLILSLGTRLRPWLPYPQRKDLLYLLNRKMGEPQSTSGRLREREKSFASAGDRIRLLGSRAHNLRSVLTYLLTYLLTYSMEQSPS